MEANKIGVGCYGPVCLTTSIKELRDELGASHFRYNSETAIYPPLTPTNWRLFLLVSISLGSSFFFIIDQIPAVDEAMEKQRKVVTLACQRIPWHLSPPHLLTLILFLLLHIQFRFLRDARNHLFSLEGVKKGIFSFL